MTRMSMHTAISTKTEQAYIADARAWFELCGVETAAFSKPRAYRGRLGNNVDTVYFHHAGAFDASAFRRKIAAALGVSAAKWESFHDHHGAQYTLDFGPNNSRRVALSVPYDRDAEIALLDFNAG